MSTLPMKCLCVGLLCVAAASSQASTVAATDRSGSFAEPKQIAVVVHATDRQALVLSGRGASGDLAAPLPEPSNIGLLAAGLASVAFLVRRRVQRPD